MRARTRQTRQISGALAILAALTAGAALTAPPARGQTPGAQYYTGLHLGQHSRETWPASVDFGGARADGALELARAGHGGAILGRQGESTRLELEYQRGRIKLERITLAAISETSSASSHYATAMLNAYWQPRLTGELSAFAGLGVGWASVTLPEASFSNGCHCFGPARKRGSAWQWRLGAEYRLAPQHAVFLAWTRLRLPGPHADGTPSASYRAQHFNAASLGYRYLF
ncbi:outer membrane protein [Pseudoduganella violacea]|uniref:Opacity protein-like surface antigen n=1 Tax=Pseudoduganella violacea TaxID=1715466 RepID=A0A7W5BB87_9BURK|nr:outer membrane beta-barrel protein [Pseudoduganella violacea]MBB3119972.1 opacity protein-like surface antigen [Pseudoduganella violacea]